MEISELKGKIITQIDNSDERIQFITDNGEVYIMYHDQDCCESVTVDDIVGDLHDLMGSPIILAEVISNSDIPAKTQRAESWTWTFYKLATIKGYVTIKWYGVSNGYYSERVKFERA